MQTQDQYNLRKDAVITRIEQVTEILKKKVSNKDSFSFIPGSVEATDKLIAGHKITEKELRAAYSSSVRSIKQVAIFPTLNSLTIQKISEQFVKNLDANRVQLFFADLRMLIERYSALKVGADLLIGMNTDLLERIRDKDWKSADFFDDGRYIEVEKLVYGTRLDWQKLKEGGFRNSKVSQIKYTSDDGNKDLSAQNILRKFDKADKEIRGLRICYEFLCEFLHPNVGDLFDCTISLNSTADAWGNVWGSRNIGLGYSNISETGPNLIEEIFDITLDVYNGIENKHMDLRKVKINLNNFLRQTIRMFIISTPYAFHAKENCWCESGKKLASCCGKKIPSLVRT